MRQISHNAELGVFTVLGMTGKPHAICLFPKESCSCPATSMCYHILAVHMSIRLQFQECGKRNVNLTQLSHNTRSESEKKSGRKAPRPGDYQVSSAPDSERYAK